MGLPPKNDPGPPAPGAWTSVNPPDRNDRCDGASSPHYAEQKSEVWQSPRGGWEPANRTEVQALPQSGPQPDSEGTGDGDCDEDDERTCSMMSNTEAEDPLDKTPLGIFVNSSPFQNFTLFIIVLNGIWIGLDVEYNHPLLEKDGKLPLEPVSTIIEHLFCVYFTVEILLRIIAFRVRNCKDVVFWFDFVLVLFMVVETWVLVIIEAVTGLSAGGLLSKFSCLRLLRLTRLVRLMRSLPELLTLVRGMLNAARAVSAVLLFMLMIMYVFAIVFTAQLGDPDAPERKLDPYWVRDSDPTSVELFGSMGDSMMTLFTRGLLGDNLAETLQAIKDRAGPWECEDPDDLETCGREGGPVWLMWVFILFFIISAFCVLNMLVGILCEVIEGTAQEEAEQNNVISLRSSICDAFRTIDISGDEYIKEDEWKAMRDDPNVRDAFVGIGVEEEFLDLRLDQMEEHLFGRLDKNKILNQEHSWIPPQRIATENTPKGIPLEKFVQRILDIRPDIDASYLDVEILKTRAERDERTFMAQCDNIERMLHERRNKINGIHDASRQPVGEVTTVEDLAGEPKNGTSSEADIWIQGISTAVLFAELRHRAAVQSGSSVPVYVD